MSVQSSIRQTLKTHFGFSLQLRGDDFITKLLQQDGGFEFPETDLVTRLLRPGDVCIDAGCQVGYYSCLFAKCVGPAGRIYAIDANPAACEDTLRNAKLNEFQNVEVVHAALGNQRGNTLFYVSTDDQSGLSSLGALQNYKEIISAPWLRLEDFLVARKIPKVRLLKLDVEGSEEITLQGLGNCLAGHRVDFILLECYDERLRLLNTSAEKVAGLMFRAGYSAWEYGVQAPNAWSRTDQVMSRGDCNYLFCHPHSADSVPVVSMAGVVQEVHHQCEQLRNHLKSAGQRICEQEQQPTGESMQRGDRMPGFSPAQALWNQRERLQLMRPRVEELHATIASPGELSLYQWAQLTASALEYQPDLIVVLGRGAGSSTACFLEAANQLGIGKCKVISVCLNPTWHESTLVRLQNVVSQNWFDAGHIVQENILTFDFQSALNGSKRCLVFWDEQGFEVAECILGSLLPLIVSREHLILMHDLSDIRHSSPDPNYSVNGLWKGENVEQRAMWLGWIFSRVPQAISILDFTTRNNIPLYSADESIVEELARQPAKAAALEALLGSELGSLQAHWFWFTLEGSQQNLTFPVFSLQDSLQKVERTIAVETMMHSVGWRLLERWRKLTHSLAPSGSRRRRAYNYCLRRLSARVS